MVAGENVKFVINKKELLYNIEMHILSYKII